MKSIEHTFQSKASSTEFYNALTTIDGLSAWWTSDTIGSAELGDSLYFSFGQYAMFEFQVALLNPGKLVSWKFLHGNPDWENTYVTFIIEEVEGETVIEFVHDGFQDGYDNFENTNLAWQDYLSSLQEFCETGVGRPFSEE